MVEKINNPIFNNKATPLAKGRRSYQQDFHLRSTTLLFGTQPTMTSTIVWRSKRFCATSSNCSGVTVSMA